MADAKISALTAAAALTGTELVEIVQSGANVQTTIAAISDPPGTAATAAASAQSTAIAAIPESARDAVGAALVAGPGITIVVDDAGNTITFASAYAPTPVKVANYSPAVGELVPIDTTGGTIVITLPNNPADGAAVAMKRVAGTAAPTFACQGADVVNLAGGATTGTLTTLLQGVELIYAKASHIWYAFSNLALASLDLRYKAFSPRVTTIASSATPTFNTDICDVVSITALAAAITSMTTNLSGTPVDFQQLRIRIKDNGTARAITWGASYVSMTATLPTTTVLSKLTEVMLEWNSVTSLWMCMAVGQEV